MAILLSESLWDSFTGKPSDLAAVLFSSAADLIEQRGYSAYSADEDPAVKGITIFQALAFVIRLHEAAELPTLPPEQLDQDVADIQSEFECKLGGLLHLIGQRRSSFINSDPAQDLWSWTRDARFVGNRPVYPGQREVVRLLRLASAMITTLDTLDQ